MTQEQKDLLLKDLGGRLAFGVKCYIPEVDTTSILGAIQEDGENTLYDFWEDSRKIQYMYQLYTSEFNPCLFPMSSMTEEQKNEFNSYVWFGGIQSNWESFDGVMLSEIKDLMDFFHKNHIDYRGLIEKGLAIDATNKNIY